VLAGATAGDAAGGRDANGGRNADGVIVGDGLMGPVPVEVLPEGDGTPDADTEPEAVPLGAEDAGGDGVADPAAGELDG
jgi:hypothetical protein